MACGSFRLPMSVKTTGQSVAFAFALQNTLQNSVTVLHLQDMHKITLISPPPLFFCVQARMRRNIPESD